MCIYTSFISQAEIMSPVIDTFYSEPRPEIFMAYGLRLKETWRTYLTKTLIVTLRLKSIGEGIGNRQVLSVKIIVLAMFEEQEENG